MLAASALALVLGAVPARAETLAEAVADAYANNPNLELSRALERASRELVTQARAVYGPSLDVTARHRYTFNRTTIEDGPTFEQQGFGTSGTVALSQPLFASGRLAANVDNARANALSAREDTRAASQQLILDVIGAYVSVRRDIELYAIAVDTYELLTQQRDLTQSRYDLRDATAPDLDQIGNRAELAAGRLIQARADLESSAAAYRNLTGEYPDVLAPPPPLPPLPGIDELYESVELYNPELQSQQFFETATRAQVASARAAMGPQVVADLTGGRSPASPYDNSSYEEQLTAGVTMSVPLFRGGALSARVRETEQRNLAAQQAVEQVRRDVREGLATDYNRLRSAERALPRFESAVAAAQRAVEGVQQQETAGIRTLRDVLDVTNDLFNARSNLATAEAERYFRHASVLRQAGLLTVDLFAPGQEYDYNAYRPDGAGAAGLPLRPLVSALDSILLNRGVEDAGVEVESDTGYATGEALAYPLEPGGSR